jgi:hypothetical protein
MKPLPITTTRAARIFGRGAAILHRLIKAAQEANVNPELSSRQLAAMGVNVSNCEEFSQYSLSESILAARRECETLQTYSDLCELISSPVISLEDLDLILSIEQGKFESYWKVRLGLEKPRTPAPDCPTLAVALHD